MKKDLLMQSKSLLRKNASTILTIIGASGVIITAILAVKETPKAMRIIKDLEKYDSETSELSVPSKLECVKAAWPCYIPAVTSGVATIACIFGANILNHRQQAALTSAYIFLENSYKEYQNKVKELFGEDADRQIHSAIVHDKYLKTDITPSGENVLFYEEHYGDFFECSMLEVKDAEYRLNRKFATTGEVTMNDFFDFLGLPENDVGDSFGWSIEYMMDFYGTCWIDFEHELVQMDDGLECYIINVSAGPIGDYLPL